MSTISQIMDINIRPPPPYSLLSLYMKYCWCAKDRINLLKGQHIGLVIDLWNFCLSNHPWQIYGFLFFVVTGLFWSTISAELFFFSSPVKMSSSTSWNRNNTTMMTTTKRTKVLEEEPNNCNNQQQMATTATKLRGYLQVKQNPTTRRSRLPRKVHNTIILHTGFIKEAKSFTICGFHIRAKFTCLITKGSNPMINNITMILSFIITTILQ